MKNSQKSRINSIIIKNNAANIKWKMLNSEEISRQKTKLLNTEVIRLNSLKAKLMIKDSLFVL